MSEKTYLPYEANQMMLLPPSLQDWLPQGHLAYFVLNVVKHLDLSQITMVYEKERRGAPPYNPRMMVAILVYAYCVGVPSSRKIGRRLEEDIAFRVLSANNRPDFRTISDFRKIHLKALKGLFVQVLRMCQKAGLVKLGNVALDGTKMKANASKHKAMSYDRMTKEEERLEAEVDALLKQAEETDEREDGEHGRNRRGDELPAELSFRESRLKKIAEAKAALEREAREKAQAKLLENEALVANGTRAGPKAKEPDPAPAPKAQKNFTDPESRIMPSSGNKGSFVQGYNCQAAVDGQEQVIVAADVTQEANDKKQAEPMLKQVVCNAGEVPKKSSMDAGYFSEGNVAAVEGLGIEALIPPDRQEHGKAIPSAARGRMPKSLSAADKMRRKLRTKSGRGTYAKRKVIVEPVFGQIKQGRGFRQFLLRGLEQVKGEWSLICSTHNVLKLWRSGVSPGGGRSAGAAAG
jgi:transposase